MNWYSKIKNYVIPPKRSFAQQCIHYAISNPASVAKGAVGGVLAWYTIPVVVVTVSWLPYIGMGWYVYNTTQKASTSWAWIKWGKSVFDSYFK